MADLEFKELKELKDIYLAKKQGEALERITKPQNHGEGLGLGFYGPQTVLALNSIDLLEDVINDLCGIEGNTLHVFTRGICISSGSRQAKRMEKSLETIGQLGQYYPFNKGFEIPKPEIFKAPTDD